MMQKTSLPEAPGWYIHESDVTGLQVYRVAFQGVPGYPTLAAQRIVWSAGKQYRAIELPGTWYGPLDLRGLIASTELPML